MARLLGITILLALFYCAFAATEEIKEPVPVAAVAPANKDKGTPVNDLDTAAGHLYHGGYGGGYGSGFGYGHGYGYGHGWGWPKIVYYGWGWPSYKSYSYGGYGGKITVIIYYYLSLIL